jgi:hypothetical protein
MGTAGFVNDRVYRQNTDKRALLEDANSSSSFSELHRHTKRLIRAHSVISIYQRFIELYSMTGRPKAEILQDTIYSYC